MSSPYQEGHPIFAQSHSFLLDALNVQRLEIAVKNADNSQIIGRCCIPLFVIEDAACMQKCGWFHLYQDGEYLTGEILLYLRLRSLRRANLLYLDNDDAFGEGLMATPGVLGTGIVRHSEGTEKIPRPNQPYDVLEFANPGIHTIPKDLNGSGSGEKTKNDDMSQTIESLEKEDTPQLLPTAELKIQRKFTTEKQALRVELQSVSNTEPLVKKIENKGGILLNLFIHLIPKHLPRQPIPPRPPHPLLHRFRPQRNHHFPKQNPRNQRLQIRPRHAHLLPPIRELLQTHPPGRNPHPRRPSPRRRPLERFRPRISQNKFL